MNHGFKENILTYYFYGVFSLSAESCLSEIKQKYTEPHRFYHTIGHVEKMLNEFNAFNSGNSDYPNLILAIIYHDVIYKPKRSDNELKSAAFAEKQLKRLNYPFRETEIIKQLILSTKKHELVLNSYQEKLLLDLDLIILGTPEKEYLAYAENIRKEYSFVPRFLYRKKRKEVLQNFLSKDKIYFTDEFHAKYEKQARRNIKFEITDL